MTAMLTELTSAWWAWVVASSWQVALMAMLVALACATLRRQSAQIRYWLWLLVLIKVFTPPSLGVSWGVGHWGVRPAWTWLSGMVERQLPERIAADADATVTLPPQEEMPPETFQGEDGDAASPEEAGYHVRSPEVRMDDSPEFSRQHGLLLTWALGALGLAGWVLLRYGRIRRLLREATEIEEGPLRVALESLTLRLGGERAPALLVSEHVTSPFLMGLVRPRIVLPAGLAGQLEPGQVESVLLHELMHWQRHDLLVGWLQLLAQSLFWFHPLVWLANAQLRHERECACDEAVLATGCAQPNGYGRSLLQVLLASRGRSSAAMGFLGIFERNTRLQRRLEEIMNQEHGTRGVSWWSRMAVVMFMLVCVPMAPVTLKSQAAGSQGGDPAAFRAKLAQPVTVTAEQSPDGNRLTVQYAAIAICETVGIPYNWNKSAQLADPERRRFIAPLHLKDVAAEKALGDVLQPVGLRFDLDGSGLFLTRATGAATTVNPDTDPARWLKETAIVTFKARAPYMARTPEDLLGPFNERHPGGVASHHFRTEVIGGQLIGHICIDSQAGTEAVQDMLRKHDKLELVRSIKGTPENFRTHTAMGQPSLEAGGGAVAVRPPEDPKRPPRIVATTPKVGAKNVDPALSEITVTFDRDMNTETWAWTGGGPVHPPTPEGKRPSWRDKRTCVMPVKLAEGRFYRVGINWLPRFAGFRSAAGVPVPTDVIYFTTRGADAAQLALAVKPKIVRLEPANGAKGVATDTKELRVTFNVPMGGGCSWCGDGPNYPESPQGARVSWTEDKKTCIFPVTLKQDWEYYLGLNSPSFKNFCNEGGVPLDPVEYSFQTGK